MRSNTAVKSFASLISPGVRVKLFSTENTLPLYRTPGVGVELFYVKGAVVDFFAPAAQIVFSPSSWFSILRADVLIVACQKTLVTTR